MDGAFMMGCMHERTNLVYIFAAHAIFWSYSQGIVSLERRSEPQHHKKFLRCSRDRLARSHGQLGRRIAETEG